MVIMNAMSGLLLLLATTTTVQAHQSIWTKSMYGVGPDFTYLAGDPVSPIGPSLTTQDSWWFRGPAYRALPPQDNSVTDLPAGGSITLEIACNVAWTTEFGVSPTAVGSDLDACPNNPGAYHAGDPAAKEPDDNLVSGCALAIADVDNIEKVTMDNLVVFSVQSKCVRTKMTQFEVPAKMPPCTGSKCICGWFWLANNGTTNFYMTGFDCSVSNSPADATPIASPSNARYCDSSNTTCTLTSGAKRPLYAYNEPTNIEDPWGNNNRPGYHSNWSFNDGPQDDIFVKAATVISTTMSSEQARTAPTPRPTGTEALVATTTPTPRTVEPRPAKLVSSSSASSSTAAGRAAAPLRPTPLSPILRTPIHAKAKAKAKAKQKMRKHCQDDEKDFERILKKASRSGGSRRNLGHERRRRM